MANTLVTGGAGFIGSNLARRLLREGHRVSIIDDLSTGRRENMADFISDVQLFEGSLCDEEIITRALEGQDTVFHLAAIPSVQRSVDDPIRINTANISATLNLLWYALKKDVKKVVVAASSSAYGDAPSLPKKEDMKTAPLSPYAVTKLTGEYYAQVFHSVYGLPTVCLRYFNVFGPFQDPTSEYSAVIPLFITKIRKGETPVIYGDGEQSRDFTYVDNVLDANLLAMQTEAANGKVLNIACGERYSLNDLVRMINKILGSNLSPDYGPVRKGDVKHSLADISLAKELLGFQPSIGFEDGLKKLIEWFDEVEKISS